MKNGGRTFNTFKRLIPLFVVVTFILIQYAIPNSVPSLEKHFAKLSVLALGKMPHAKEVVIVAVDDRTEVEFGQWDSKLASKLSATLGKLGAKLVAFDANTLKFEAPSDLRIIEKTGTLTSVLGYELFPTLRDIPKGKLKTEVSELNKLILPTGPLSDSKIFAAADVDFKFKVFEGLDWVSFGFSNLFAKKRQLVAGIPLVARYHGLILPSFSVAVCSKWLGFTPMIAEDASGSPNGLSIGDAKIKTSADTVMTLALRGGNGTFPRFSASDVISERVVANEFSEKIVLIGATQKRLKSFHETFLGKMDDIEIQANAVDNILYQRNLVSWIGLKHTAIFLLVLGFVSFFGLAVVSLKKVFFVTLGNIIAIWVAGFALFLTKFIWIPVIWLTLASVFIFIFLTAFWLFTWEIPFHKLKRDFKGRLSSSSIRGIASKSSILSSADNEKTVTAVAIDIRGFGRISESMSKDKLTSFLAAYRGVVSETLLTRGAFIDSFASDECRAIFGAPIELREHAMCAVSASLEIRELISHKISLWNERYGIDAVRLAVGIQTGLAVSGRSGSVFSIVGSALESAVLLKNLCHSYRTWALVGNTTFEETKTSMSYRALDPVRIYGQSSPSIIHELVGKAGSLLPSSRAFEEARKVYLAGDFEKAASLFEEILKIYPGDGPSKLFYKRAVTLSKNPKPSWSGVWET